MVYGRLVRVAQLRDIYDANSQGISATLRVELFNAAYERRWDSLGVRASTSLPEHLLTGICAVPKAANAHPHLCMPVFHAGFVEIELEPDTAPGYCEMPLQRALDAGCAAIGHFPQKDEPRLRAVHTTNGTCREMTFVISEGSVRLGTTPESVVAVPYAPPHR